MKNKEFIVILAITLLVVVIWVISDLAHTKSDANNLPDVKAYLDQLDPNFDQETLDKVSALGTPAPAPSGLPASSSARPTPLPTPRPSLPPSASPSASASATPR